MTIFSNQSSRLPASVPGSIVCAPHVVTHWWSTPNASSGSGIGVRHVLSTNLCCVLMLLLLPQMAKSNYHPTATKYHDKNTTLLLPLLLLPQLCGSLIDQHLPAMYAPVLNTIWSTVLKKRRLSNRPRREYLIWACKMNVIWDHQFYSKFAPTLQVAV